MISCFGSFKASHNTSVRSIGCHTSQRCAAPQAPRAAFQTTLLRGRLCLACEEPRLVSTWSKHEISRNLGWFHLGIPTSDDLIVDLHYLIVSQQLELVTSVFCGFNVILWSGLVVWIGVFLDNPLMKSSKVFSIICWLKPGWFGRCCQSKTAGWSFTFANLLSSGPQKPIVIKLS